MGPSTYSVASFEEKNRGQKSRDTVPLIKGAGQWPITVWTTHAKTIFMTKTFTAESAALVTIFL